MIVSTVTAVIGILAYASVVVYAAYLYQQLKRTVRTNNGLHNLLKEDGEMMLEIHASIEDLRVKLENKNARLVKASQYISASPVIPQEEKLMVVGILADQTLNERILDKIEEVKSDSTNTRR